MTPITAREAAKHLGISLSQMYYRIRAGKMDEYLCGVNSSGHQLIDLDKLRANPPPRGNDLSRRRFRPEDIASILNSDESHAAIARRLGCSYQNIQQIRWGQRYRDIHPEIPRWTPLVNASCHQCKHYSNTICGMGFPELQEIGHRAARECGAYDATD